MAKSANEPTLALRAALIAEILGEKTNRMPPGSPGEHIIRTLVTSAMTSPKSARWVYEQFEGKATQTQHILSDNRSRVIVEVVTVDMVSGKPQLAAGDDSDVIDVPMPDADPVTRPVSRTPARAAIELTEGPASLPPSGTAVAIDLDGENGDDTAETDVDADADK
jgi:hypothetical protein